MTTDDVNNLISRVGWSPTTLLMQKRNDLVFIKDHVMTNPNFDVCLCVEEWGEGCGDLRSPVTVRNKHLLQQHPSFDVQKLLQQIDRFYARYNGNAFIRGFDRDFEWIDGYVVKETRDPEPNCAFLDNEIKFLDTRLKASQVDAEHAGNGGCVPPDVPRQTNCKNS